MTESPISTIIFGIFSGLTTIVGLIMTALMLRLMYLGRDLMIDLRDVNRRALSMNQLRTLA
ncbi:hypothetical protein BDV95DRAFT_609837 [Massariosphaeria phaeospora]|uniref:Uncharacterized protein n=1 Tax=Massariosphaeria phaeospora TaxID=100035 RepID=A0A7C8I988_9PLEO|nr:hypothetical protein BDV95DRAFT_609837 [Massariosphaeria phaeospora]